MKSCKSTSLALVLGSLIFTALACTTRAGAETVLIDFGNVREDMDPNGTITKLRVYDHVWGDWEKGTRDLRHKGVLIECPKNNGTLGQERNTVRFGGSKALVFAYVVGNRNAAQRITFKMTDADGTAAEWNIPLAGKKIQIVNTATLDLDHPDSLTGGKTPGLDSKHIDSWEVHGDWSDARLEVLLIKILSIPL